jgi:leucyl/phenylalanyl-tRNA---protein transferase
MEDELQRPRARTLVHAYAQGFFPMVFEPGGEIEWIRPHRRAVLPLNAFRVSRSLRRLVRRGAFDIRSDTAFAQVMRCCAERHDGEETWIDERLVRAFTELHELGGAHSVEAWRDGELVAGLYGVHLGGAFFGESMFIRPELGGSGGSKVCLVHLVEHLNRCGFRLLDTQIANDHMAQFGVREIPDARFMILLEQALAVSAPWRPFPGG